MDTQAFEIFAELSVAILGFSGVAAVLGDTSKNDPFVSARVRGLLICACIAATGSILPLTGLDLTYCAVLLIVLFAGSQGWAVFGLMRQTAARPSWLIFYCTMVAIIAGIAAMTWGLLEDRAVLIHAYIYSVNIMLFFSGLFFVRMVLAITAEKDASS